MNILFLFTKKKIPFVHEKCVKAVDINSCNIATNLSSQKKAWKKEFLKLWKHTDWDFRNKQNICILVKLCATLIEPCCVCALQCIFFCHFIICFPQDIALYLWTRSFSGKHLVKNSYFLLYLVCDLCTVFTRQFSNLSLQYYQHSLEQCFVNINIYVFQDTTGKLDLK